MKPKTIREVLQRLMTDTDDLSYKGIISAKYEDVLGKALAQIQEIMEGVIGADDVNDTFFFQNEEGAAMTDAKVAIRNAQRARQRQALKQAMGGSDD